MTLRSSTVRIGRESRDRYFSAFVSQGIVSVFHFALNLVLVRQLEPAEYGVFALAFAVGFIVSSMSNALFTVPLSVFRPAVPPEERRKLDSAIEGPVIAFAGVVVIVGALGSLLSGSRGASLQVIASALFIATYVARVHARGAGYARFDVAEVLRADLIYVATSGTAIAIAFLAGSADRAALVLTVLSFGNVFSTAFISRRRPSTLSRPLTMISEYAPYWRYSKWALLGAVSTMVVAQGHSVMISLLRDPQTFAPIAAGFALFGPVRVLFTTVQNVLRPEMARTLAETNWRLALRQAVVSTAVAVMAVLGLCILLVAAWGVIFEQLYEGTYNRSSMVEIVTWWAVASVFFATGTGSSALLQALREFRALAFIGLAAGLANLIMVTIALTVFSARSTIVAVALAEAIMSAGMWLLLSRTRAAA